MQPLRREPRPPALLADGSACAHRYPARRIERRQRIVGVDFDDGGALRHAAAQVTHRAQVALAWLLHKPAVTAPIIGASKPAHLDDAVAALSLQLTAEEIEALQQLYVPHPIVGFS